jgi:hypothetical protein
MKQHYRYIFLILIIFLVYTPYLIIREKYTNFETESYGQVIESKIKALEKQNSIYQDHLTYTKTNAFLDKVAKSYQNKKNPGEIAFFSVDETAVNEYAKVDVEKQIVGDFRKQTISRTAGMQNWQKWVFYLMHVDMR